MQIISSTLLCVQSHNLDCGRMVCAGGRGSLLLLVLVTSLLASTAGLATCKRRDNRRPRKWRRSGGKDNIEVIIPYNFVEKENRTVDLKNGVWAFHNDTKIGFVQSEMEVVMKAMERIERQTCIKFSRTEPKSYKDMWLLLLKEWSGETGTCHDDYLNLNLKHTSFPRLGKVFSRGVKWRPCVEGAYVTKLGNGQPSFLVASQMNITDTEDTIGVFVRQLLHVLGVDNTHRRIGTMTAVAVVNIDTIINKCL